MFRKFKSRDQLIFVVQNVKSSFLTFVFISHITLHSCPKVLDCSCWFIRISSPFIGPLFRQLAQSQTDCSHWSSIWTIPVLIVPRGTAPRLFLLVHAQMVPIGQMPKLIGQKSRLFQSVSELFLLVQPLSPAPNLFLLDQLWTNQKHQQLNCSCWTNHRHQSLSCSYWTNHRHQHAPKLFLMAQLWPTAPKLFLMDPS